MKKLFKILFAIFFLLVITSYVGYSEGRIEALRLEIKATSEKLADCVKENIVILDDNKILREVNGEY